MKRIFDIFFSLILLIILLPVILIFCIAVKLSMGNPIFFTQLRPGLDGKLFKIIKFRTMKNSLTNEIDTNLDMERTTKLGAFMRSYSIDELPELLNVLLGDMSLVGPRPLLKEYLSEYSNKQMKRHSVKPGITGWAQINGRNTITWEEKFNLDIWYIENQNLILDLKILILTLINVLLKRNINKTQNITNTKYKNINK